MLTYFVNPSAHEPLYEQLYRQIRDAIENRVLPSMTKLPSKRALAGHLKISIVTVQTAYEQLLAEGYIRSVERSGYFVETVEAIAPKRSVPRQEPSEDAPAPHAYDLRTNTVDPALFPSKMWSRLTRAVLSEQKSDLWNAVDTKGSLRLRHAIASHLERFRGVSVDPSSVVVGTGSEYLLDLLVKLLPKGSLFAVEHPGFAKVAKVFDTAGAEVVGIPVDGLGLDVEALDESGAGVVHVTPSHQFPTGVVMPFRRRTELLKWSREKPGRFIIEDDYDSEFRFGKAPIPALKRLDEAGSVIYLNSFTKSLAPSLRIAYMVLPAQLEALFGERFAHLHCPVPNLEQETLSMFLEDGHFERHVNRMKIAYRDRRDRFLDWIRSTPLLANALVRGEDAGLHFLLCPNCGLEEDELIRRALDHGVRVYGLSPFGKPQGFEDVPTIVVGYAGVPDDRLDDLFDRLNRAWSPSQPDRFVLQ
jgi:GntR family transcriptional regulator/MocR family aminotransferase